MGTRYGSFRDIDQGLHKIVIEGNHIDGNKEFTLYGTPITTTMDETDNLYTTTIKTQGATISIVTPDYPFEVYSPSLLETRVTMTNEDTGQVEWKGFLTPQMFDMSFREHYVVMELEAVDGLSALKDLPYRRAVEGKQRTVTFAEIIGRICGITDCWKKVYITDNVQLKVNGNDSVIDILKIQEQNFFKNQDTIDATDDDVAQSCYEVLEAILLFLGYTVSTEGENLFIMDWDAIKSGNNQYWEYNVSGGSIIPTNTKKTFSKQVYINENHAKTNERLSLDMSYNYCTVKDEFNVIKEDIPSLSDDSLWVNVTSPRDDVAKQMSFKNNKPECEDIMWSDNFTYTTKNGNVENLQILALTLSHSVCVLAIKFYKTRQYIQHRYDCADGNKDIYDHIMWDGGTCYSDMVNKYNGTFLIKYYWKPYKEYYEFYNNFVKKIFPTLGDRYVTNAMAQEFYDKPQEERMKYWQDLLGVSPMSLTMTPLIVNLNVPANYIKNNSSNKDTLKYEYGNENLIKYPFLELADGASSITYQNEDAYIKITGSVQSNDRYVAPCLEDPDKAKQLKRHGDFKYRRDCYLVAQLAVGDKWWDGRNSDTTGEEKGTPINQWVDDPNAYFKIFWFKKGTSDKEMNNENNWGRFNDFYPEDDRYSNFGEKGIYIPIPSDLALSGNIKFRICANRDVKGRSPGGKFKGYDRYYNYVDLIKDLKVEPVVSNGLVDDLENDSDTIYHNDCQTDKNSMDEITFTVCTDDAKKSSYSVVSYTEDGVDKLLQTTFNKALFNEVNSDGSTAQCGWRQEEWMVYKEIKQYEKPRLILDFALLGLDFPIYTTYTDKTLSGRTYLATKISKDWRMKRTDFLFIEKA